PRRSPGTLTQEHTQRTCCWADGPTWTPRDVPGSKQARGFPGSPRDELPGPLEKACRPAPLLQPVFGS
ncbi:hypothetical protein, partial [Acinetobacter baumannii]|uniref:hypothetical protein n=1 Tax=Acinetobacter baumannii TaxID=470 RepID=UPI0039EF2B51